MGLFSESEKWSFGLLGELGVICILFRVGLENDPRQLLRQLPRAVSIWIGNVVLSALLGYVAARYVLGYDLIPSLFVATALSATSVGVSVLIWESAGRLKSELGEQLIDVAELDDISAIVFMVTLFAPRRLYIKGLIHRRCRRQSSPLADYPGKSPSAWRRLFPFHRFPGETNYGILLTH